MHACLLLPLATPSHVTLPMATTVLTVHGVVWSM